MSYLLFAGESYYAKGGFNDFRGSYDTHEEAAQVLVDNFEGPASGTWDWWHVIDSSTLEVVDRSSNQAHGCDWDCYVGEDDE